MTWKAKENCRLQRRLAMATAAQAKVDQLLAAAKRKEHAEALCPMCRAPLAIHPGGCEVEQHVSCTNEACGYETDGMGGIFTGAKKCAMKKPRSDSKLKTLPREQQDLIAQWCEADGGYKAARQRCKAELQLDTSEAALSGFWRWYCLRSQFEAADGQANAMADLMREFSPGDEAKAQAFAQFVFTQSAVASKDAEKFVMLENLRLSKETARVRAKQEGQKIALAERRVEVMEKKLEQVRGTLTDDSLSTADRERKMKQLFGIPV